MRIVVMGAGGTGGYFGAKLARAGEDVTVMARGAHLQAIRAHGLRVRSAVEGEWVVRVPAHERPEGLPPADLVLFCVKAFDTDAAAAAIRPLVGPDTGVLSVQNGVDNEDRLAAILGPGHVIGGVALVFATIAEPGVIQHVVMGRLRVGEMDGRESSRVGAFLAACRRASIPAEAVADIRRALWEKYAFILAQAGTTALCRCPAGVIRRIPETRRLYQRLLEETIALARAEGVGLDAGVVDIALGALEAQSESTYSSLYHDLIQGRRLELEALHGHAARLGERHGIPTPTIFAVYAALRPARDGRADTPVG
jgi:2-dehydropantoate 2-reductase